jgi:ER-bound oxygenase mpaB/B'/Rubber oxygenase, catalytic domain
VSRPEKSWLGSKDRYARLRRIETLDPEQDSQQISALFYEDFQSVMLLQAVSGYLMTFAAPRISRILHRTGEFEQSVGKRFVDTGLLFRIPLNHGLGPGPGRDAARRVNEMHRQYDIHPDDFVMVGTDVALSALDFADKFGWRPVSEAEREAVRRHYSAVARAFGSHKPLPLSLAEMRAFWEHYVDTELGFEPHNRAMADAMLVYIAGRIAPSLRRVTTPLLLAQIDPRILSACGFKPPSHLLRSLSSAVFTLMGRRDPVPDGAPDGLMTLADTVYPDGWTVETLGTHIRAAPDVSRKPAS